MTDVFEIELVCISDSAFVLYYVVLGCNVLRHVVQESQDGDEDPGKSI